MNVGVTAIYKKKKKKKKQNRIIGRKKNVSIEKISYNLYLACKFIFPISLDNLLLTTSFQFIFSRKRILYILNLWLISNKRKNKNKNIRRYLLYVSYDNWGHESWSTHSTLVTFL
jgi:hypothetical protein